MIGAVIGTIVIVIATIVIGLLIDRKRPILPRPESLAKREQSKLVSRNATHAAGEAPATAIRAGMTQITNLRGSQRCPECRTAMTAAPDDTVRYDERDLLVLHFACPRCSTKRTVYIEQVVR